MSFPISYEIIYSKRKSVAIQIRPDGQVIVRAPYGCPRSFINSFIHQKADWIVKHSAENKQRYEKQVQLKKDRPTLSDAQRKRYKYTSMEIGKALMASDILIVLAAAWRFGMGTGLYCILGLIGKSFVVDGAIENIRLRKVCTIMTSNPQPILDFIIKEMNRSATVEKAYGAYTHHELSVLVTVLTRRQALQLRNFLRENDPHSFITIVNSSEIIGKGFRSFN